MDFNVFVEKVVSLLQEKMGGGYEIKVTKVTKNNDIRLTGIVMLNETDKVSPTIYLEEPYQRCCEGIDIHEIVEQIVILYEEQIRNMKLDMDFFSDFECVKDQIFHKVIHYEKNRRLLQDIPHFRWCDLAVVFYYAMEGEQFGKASILIHNNHMKMWEQTADSLYQTAQYNMERSRPELLIPMQRLLEEVTGEQIEEAGQTGLYVLTNQEKMYGASAMLYSQKIKKLADRWESDLLILPSSVHEVLILPDICEQKYDFYRRMVEEVNTTQVDPEEVLSYSLYRYEREKAEIKEIYV